MYRGLRIIKNVINDKINILLLVVCISILKLVNKRLDLSFIEETIETLEDEKELRY